MKEIKIKKWNKNQNLLEDTITTEQPNWLVLIYYFSWVIATLLITIMVLGITYLKNCY